MKLEANFRVALKEKQLERLPRRANGFLQDDFAWAGAGFCDSDGLVVKLPKSKQEASFRLPISVKQASLRGEPYRCPQEK